MRTLLAIPSYDGKISIRFNSAMTKCSKEHEVDQMSFISTFLPKCFNALWVAGLNARKDGFEAWCMVHDDLIPEPFFLDKMHKIMKETGADILSAISPIKDSRGITSTCLDTSPRLTRFTMQQIHDGRPKTFTDDKLLINTGCLLVNMRKNWVEQVCFRFENKIILEDGRFKEKSISEDWLFSRDARKLGAKIYATAEVSLEHIGETPYPNSFAWGSARADFVEGY